ncbi:MAG: hypothetical protein J5661_01205 [Bacteroidaceae bacterium]|nr:hypothetical protein [Bacteroidaceae bacterium]
MSQLDLFSDDSFTVDTPFTERVVCVLGTFSMPQKQLFLRLREMGAECKPGLRVSRNVHFVLVGTNAPQDQLDYLQTLAFHGFVPRVLHQQELDDIFQGHYAPYRVDKRIRKDLHLTYQHYQQFRLDLYSRQNLLYTRELYVAPDTKIPTEEFYQRLGDRGIYANLYIDDTTDAIVISDASLERLKMGETDDVIRYIEGKYNATRSQSYHYTIISEGQLVEWLES